MISSGVTTVVSHMNDDLLKTAKQSGRTPYAVVVDSDDWMERVSKETDQAGDDPEKLKKLVFRLLGSYQDRKSVV